MATYIVGDLHGSYKTFQTLLTQLDFQPGNDTLWSVGDLVNNGRDSAALVRWFYEHQDCAHAVLGNHDLHMLAVWSGARPARHKDTFQDLLQASDAKSLCHWMLSQPLLAVLPKVIVSHAGLLPHWELETACEAAAEVEAALRGGDHKAYFQTMYGDEPRSWPKAKTKEERQRLTINALTRMRAVNHLGELEFKFKAELKDLPPTLQPWFRHPERPQQDKLICFGHWSALGLHQEADIISLDSGCTWGRALSAYRVEDGTLFSVPAIG